MFAQWSGSQVMLIVIQLAPCLPSSSKISLLFGQWDSFGILGMMIVELLWGWLWISSSWNQSEAVECFTSCVLKSRVEDQGFIPLGRKSKDRAFQFPGLLGRFGALGREGLYKAGRDCWDGKDGLLLTFSWLSFLPRSVFCCPLPKILVNLFSCFRSFWFADGFVWHSFWQKMYKQHITCALTLQERT